MLIIGPEVIQNSQNYNETEVRFHVIDPILRKLGYSGNDEVYLKLEEKLDYPYFFIGHKSKKKDLPLGYPDYRAGLKGARGSFIVEAKSGAIDISVKDIEQAHSYAAHAQVGANYFLLCNGSQLSVFETLSGATHLPILTLGIKEIDARFHELENILSPVSLRKNCLVSYDSGLRLSDDLNSSVKIVSGIYSMDFWETRYYANGIDCTVAIKAAVPQIAAIDQQLADMQQDFELRVSDGIAERDVDGQIVAKVNFSGVTKNSLQAMKLLGISTMSFSTKEKFLSSDKNTPTHFQSTADFSVEKGTMVPPLFGAAVPTDVDMIGDLLVTARLYKSGQQLLGEYAALCGYELNVPGLGELIVELDFAGSISVQILS